MEAFHREAAGAVEVTVIRQARDGGRLLLAALAGRPYAVGLLRALGQWVARIEVNRPRCLNGGCTHEFSARGLPAGFLIAWPYRDDAMHCLVSGICPACTAANDDMAIAGWLRQIWPDGRIVDVSEGGRA